MNLKSAYREIGFKCKNLMIPKQSKTPKDVFSLMDAIEQKDGQYHKVKLSGHPGEIQEVIGNKNIIKRYYSEDIIEDKKYLGLMVLGIRFLEMTACFEDIPEAQQIFDQKLREEIKDVMGQVR